MELTQSIIAEKFVYPLWRSLDDGYKERYMADAWEHLENAIRTSSYTNSLKKFLSNIKSRLPIVPQAKFAADIIEISDSGKDSLILDWLRTETAYLVTKARVMNQEIRDAKNWSKKI